MFHYTDQNTQAFIDLRQIAFSTEKGSGRHVPHDEKLNHICFTDGKQNYEVDCTDEGQLHFTNYNTGGQFILNRDVGVIFFQNAMTA